MIVKKHGDVPVHALPGIRHRTLAGPADGLRGMEIWYQRVAPGAETPWHRHDCEEAVVILQGSGVCEAEGERRPFGPDSTVIIPPGVVHRITNTGQEELILVAGLSVAPVVVETPQREPMPLPWTG